MRNRLGESLNTFHIWGRERSERPHLWYVFFATWPKKSRGKTSTQEYSWEFYTYWLYWSLEILGKNFHLRIFLKILNLLISQVSRNLGEKLPPENIHENSKVYTYWLYWSLEISGENFHLRVICNKWRICLNFVRFLFFFNSLGF